MNFKSPIKLLEQLEKEGKVIPATYDRAFRRVMTNCKDYLALILSNFIDIPIDEIRENLVYKNTELMGSSYKEKRKVADLIVEINGHIINLEMNRDYYSRVIDRNSAYYHKIATTLYEEGDEYRDIEIIQINFDNYTIYEDDEVVLEFKLLNTKKHYEAKENYKIYHINLERLREKYYNEEELEDIEKKLLVLCLDDKKILEVVSKSNNALRKVRCELENISKDLDFLLYYDEEKEKEMINQCKIDDAKKEGHESGLKEGHESGLKEGRESGLKEGRESGFKEGIIKTAKEMINKKIDFDTISDCTGLTIEELSEIK